ncbi:MAG: hypothetical protein ACRC6V_03530 [Bacteroidales bacterium]
MQYRESGKTLTSVLSITTTTTRTRDTSLTHNTSARLTVDDDFTQLSIGISKTKTYVIPLDAIKKCITITGSHRFLVLYRPNESIEFSVLAVSTGQFHLMGAFVGQLAIQGDYVDETRLSLVYS